MQQVFVALSSINLAAIPSDVVAHSIWSSLLRLSTSETKIKSSAIGK